MKTIHILLFLVSFNLINCLGPFPSTSPHPVKPRTPSMNKFVPTNTWYQNWLVGTGESTVHTYPYMLKAGKDGLFISYANQMVNQAAYILEVFNANLALSVRETFDAPTLDDSTVNDDALNIGAKLNFGKKFDVIAVRGSASLVANIHSATPALKTIHAIIGQQNVSDRTFKISFNNGQSWLLQSETSISWSVSSSEIFSPTVYNGWLKISIVTSNEAETALKNTHDLIITNGRVTHSVDRSTSPGEVTIRVDYDSQGLYYLLPHVINPTETTNIKGASAKGIKGTYLLSQGLGYHYKIPVFETDFKDIQLSQENINELRLALSSDVTLEILSKDPYFGGKELARTAKLIEIADLIGDATLKTKAKDVLVEELDSFWFGIGNSTPALVYEPTWGGIVSRKSVGSPETDFGIYYYNDHHFHYGYFINAAATLAKHYPDYYKARSEYFNIILADYAGTCLFKELPCRPRNKDPFLGHSYAAGIFEFADSRNQESTSEAINAYFAVRELGKALNNQTLHDLGDYLLSTEIIATKTYWQIKKQSAIYPEPYAKNGVVGILWETKVDYATFFGSNVEFIYGIQMLPFNDITTKHLDRDWLSQTRSIWSKPINTDEIEEGWKGILLLADSIVDSNRNGLSEQIHNLKDYDNGNTRTNTLYFYYMMGGLGDDWSPISTTQDAVTGTGPTVSTTTKCNDCDTTDVGRPDPDCGTGSLFGCHNTSGTMVGCYEPSVSTCFPGGNMCPKPLKACFIPTFPVQGAPCYDTSIYDCVNGVLVLSAGGIIG